ncbi:MAG: helicase HerA domain-containing protein [Candidatus Kariarchaeaceae archaeon]
MSKTERLSSNIRREVIDVENALVKAVKAGSPKDFTKAFYKYEGILLDLAALGLIADTEVLTDRLVKILKNIINTGDLTIDRFAPLGAYYVQYSYDYLGRIYERVLNDLRSAITARVDSLRLSRGFETIEELLLIEIDLLLSAHISYAQQYEAYAHKNERQIIKEVAKELASHPKSFLSYLIPKGDPETVAGHIFDLTVELLALLANNYRDRHSIKTEAFSITRRIKSQSHVKLTYLEERLMVLESAIETMQLDPIDNTVDTHMRSRIIPFTLLDEESVPELEKRMKTFYDKRKLDVDIQVSYVPILGAVPAGPPHLAVIGQTGQGKTTLVRHIIRENSRLLNASSLILDRHREFEQVADIIIQFGVEKREEADVFVDITQLVNMHEDARQFMQNQLVSGDFNNSELLFEKMGQFEGKTKPMMDAYFNDSIEAELAKRADELIPLADNHTIVYWFETNYPEVDDVIVNVLLKHFLTMALNNKFNRKTIIVNEEAQRLSGSKWVRNIVSEGRKFGLYLVSISQAPEFDPWVISNSRLIIFNVKGSDFKNITDGSYLSDDEFSSLIRTLDVGEYLTYDRSARSWFVGYNPESLMPVHAKKVLTDKIKNLKRLNKR